MRIHNVLFVLLVVGIFLVSSCAQYGQKTAQPTAPAPTQPSQPQIQQKPQPTTPAAPAQTAATVKEFKVTAKKFQFDPATIEVNKGDKVRLIVTSTDVPHGISIPEYGINERLDPGKPVAIEFTADKQGTFTAFCSLFCGSGHSGMKGKIIIK